MKKALASIIVGLAISTASYADIDVGWAATAGFLADAGGTPLLQGGGSVLAQLIYSATGVIGTANDDAGNDYLGVGNDNQLLDSFTLTGTEYGDFSRSAQIYAGYNAGFVYARIFQSTTPTAGSWYYNSPLQSVPTYDPLAPVFQTLEVNRDTSNGDGVYASAANNFQVQSVPEPTTMALLGLGGLLMALRRRKA